MLTIHSDQSASRLGAPQDDAHESEDRVGTTVVHRVRSFVCGMQGHDNLMKMGRDRIYLECASCGHESPGWALTGVPPRVKLYGDARRHALKRPRLVSERQVA